MPATSRRPIGRLAAAVMLASIVAGATAAWAAETQYTGTVTEQARAGVEFTLVQRPDGTQFVRPFRFEHIRLTCFLGPSHLLISHDSFKRIPVVDDVFHKTKHPSDVGAAVKGRLVRKGHARGRLRVTEDAAKCDSGILHWHAHA